MTKSHLTGFLTLLLVLASSGTAGADFIWQEVGDAGALPGAAQQIVGGSGSVLAISGTISTNNDADVYLIFINDPAAFSATTNGQPGTLVDTQLFLFSAAGFGIEANDNVSLSNPRSTLPAGNPLSPTVPGLYLLAISSFNNDPVAPGGLRIFPELPGGVGIAGASGPGGNLPFAGFNNGGQSSGTYQIALTGVIPVPEPASCILLGVGLAGVAGYGRRPRQRRQA